jgi:hypothetical protein
MLTGASEELLHTEAIERILYEGSEQFNPWAEESVKSAGTRMLH